MEVFHWTNDYETGISTVDEQHQKLVAMLNELAEQFAVGQLSASQLTHLVAGLKAYTEYHFGEEEQLMDTAAVDPRHADAHKVEHQKFIQTVNEAAEGLDPSDSTKVEQLVEFLVD